MVRDWCFSAAPVFSILLVDTLQSRLEEMERGALETVGLLLPCLKQGVHVNPLPRVLKLLANPSAGANFLEQQFVCMAQVALASLDSADL
jgi:hypothetical protein